MNLVELTLNIVCLEVHELVLNTTHGHECSDLVLKLIEETTINLVRVKVGERRACEGKRVVEVNLVSQLIHNLIFHV